MIDNGAPETEAETMRRGLAILADRLPAGWSVELDTGGHGDRGADGLIELTAADGKATTLVVESKRVVEGRDVEAIRAQLDASAAGIPGSAALLMARYLSPPVRERLARAGISYVDATGNVRVEVSVPGLFVSDRGADRDPWRGPGRPRGTLKGAPPAKIVRALADIGGPWTVRELVKVAQVSTGAAYRVIEYLEREGLAVRDESGSLTVPDWAELLRRWSDEYGFVRSSRVTRWIAPRGLPDLVRRASASDTSVPYAVTGTLAAAEWAEYAPARSAMVYTADAAALAALWDLRPADVGANVMLAEPEFDVVYERTVTRGGLCLAAPTQVVVDLMTGPGRAPSEAEELLDWMVRNEASWRV